MLLHGTFDGYERQVEKQRSREGDAEALRNGEIAPADLARRNGFFSSVDLRGACVVAIGAREARALRAREE